VLLISDPIRKPDDLAARRILQPIRRPRNAPIKSLLASAKPISIILEEKEMSHLGPEMVRHEPKIGQF
jgi:hypothetical protein